MRFNRFVFLNRPILSLEVHLGVTASPQTPFPTDYVTLPVSSRSPPIRLSSPRSRRRAVPIDSWAAFHSCSSNTAVIGGQVLAGRTVGDVRHPHLIRTLCLKRLVQNVVMHRVVVLRVRGRLVLANRPAP